MVYESVFNSMPGALAGLIIGFTCRNKSSWWMNEEKTSF